MMLSHCVVALDSCGNVLKTYKSTLVRSQAESQCNELREALGRRSRKVNGVPVEDFEIVSEPV